MIARLSLTAILILSCSAHATEQRDTLQALYEALGGAQWKRSNGWLTDAPIRA